MPQIRRWRQKPGTGVHRQDGSTYGPGDVIESTREKLGGALDKFDPVDGEEDVGVPEDELPTAGAVKVHKGGGWYDIVRTDTGESLNDKPLREADANEFVEKLRDQVPAGDADDAAEDKTSEKTTPTGGDRKTGDSPKPSTQTSSTTTRSTTSTR